MYALLTKIQRNDVQCFYILNRTLHGRTLNIFMKAITQMGSTVFAVMFSLSFIAYNRYMGLVLIGNLLSSQIIIHLLKRIVDRPRPYKTLEWAIAINPPKCEYSLPSGHSGSALSIAMVLALFFPSVKIIFISIAILVGISRIYLGAHYPTDVLLGFIISYSTNIILECFVFN